MLSLRTKLISCCLLICLGIAANAWIGYQSMTKVVDQFDRLAQVSVPKLGHLSGMRTRGRQIQSELLTLALFSEKKDIYDLHMEGLNKALTRYQDINSEYEKMGFFSPDEQKAHDAVNAKWNDVHQHALFLKKYFENHLSMTAELHDRLLELDKSVVSHQKLLLELDDINVAQGEAWTEESRIAAAAAKKHVVTIAGSTFGIALLAAILISQLVSLQLRRIASKLGEGTYLVWSHSQKVANASVALSSSAVEQASAVEQTVAATTQISAMIERTSDSASKNLASALLTQQSSEGGRVAVNELMAAMQNIRQSSDAVTQQSRKMNKELSEIVQMIGAVENKTNIINDIALKTKLLSFNASLEAARAGEGGKAFGVVAEEVSKLASVSGGAADEITGLLMKSHQRVGEIVQESERSATEMIQMNAENVGSGHRTASGCQEAFGEIGGQIDTITKLTQDIAFASKEQATGISEINVAMNRVSAVAQQNTETSKICEDSGEALLSQMKETTAIVEELFSVIYGRSGKKMAKKLMSTYDAA
ncbi:MAG TPA: methyl-accepting chemotaxis protein [Bdellovibrionales bacterium]|nr:methyl-accepting chemotaxis protein [Bdellovibrionales bacterium]